ncbi:hypothetical protein SUGI_0015830 [Cryptomeria japonica]|nr:hypothetical protein SUGI_0015830 [Cryptomeria japonica]
MKEPIRPAARDGLNAMEAAPVTIDGLGASASFALTIIIIIIIIIITTKIDMNLNFCAAPAILTDHK